MIPKSETLERAALEDLHRAATPLLKRALGLQCIRVGSALVSIAAALPSSAIVINRSIGLGLAWPAEAGDVAALTANYRKAGVGRYFVQLHPEAKPASIPGWLRSHQLVEARGWQKFSRGTAPVEDRPASLEIREAGPEHGESFARIVCSAFDLGEEAIPWLSLLPGRENWHVFMSFKDGKAAGTGALFVRKGLAWLDFAATAPQFRRQGSQGAIQAARLQLAHELGCRRVFTCTGVAVPGDPQHSYNNILRIGFEKDYVRQNFSPRR